MNLPKSSEFNKRIPKQKFYENLTISPSLKRAFVEQIRSIHWRNKIAPTTVNISAGSVVTELEVFEIALSQATLDEAVLRQIDKEIPYHILFLLQHEEKYQAWIGYKEATVSGDNAFKVTGYYHTEWMPLDDLPLRIEGLTTDTVYENFVRQIAGDTLAADNQSLKDAVEQSEQQKKLLKEIAKLEKQAKAEKQPKKKFELVQKIQKLKSGRTL